VLLAGGSIPAATATTERWNPGHAPLASRRATATPSPSIIEANAGFAVSGSGFRPAQEASHGSTTNSAVNHPILQVQHIGSGITRWMAPDATSAITNTGFATTANAMSGLPAGAYRVTTWVGGVPSIASIIRMNPPFALRGVTSRKAHGAAGTFALAIDPTVAISGNVSIEPRDEGGSHLVVFHMAESVSSIGSTSVVNAANAPVGSPVVTTSGNEVRFALSGVPDASRIALSVNAINGTVNATAAMGFLVGDINNSRTVNASDIIMTRNRIGQTVNASNYKADINASGTIDTADVAAVKNNAGGGL
jgi:hypothetical protein